MNRLLERFRVWMQGRYGGDQLTLALLVLSMIISFLTALTRITWLSLLTYIPLIFGCYRMFSKNISKRYEENRKFMNVWHPFSLKVQKKWGHLKDQKTHKYFKCPKCGKTLRVPRGKGKIRITCPICKTEFSKKS